MTETVFESFRAALREALKDDPTGDFGAEVAVAAFDECLALAGKQGATRALAGSDSRVEPVLYCIEPKHLESLKAIAKRLYAESHAMALPMSDTELRNTATSIMTAVRFAESLEALRGTGDPYVHMTPREGT